MRLGIPEGGFGGQVPRLGNRHPAEHVNRIGRKSFAPAFAKPASAGDGRSLSVLFFDDLAFISSTPTPFSNAIKAELEKLREQVESTKDGLKEEFAEIERELVKALEEEGVTSIQPDAYIKQTERKKELESATAELEEKTSKEKNKHDEILQAVARLNDTWLKGYKLVSRALDKVNAAQSSLN